MTINLNVPQPTQTLGQTHTDIRGNWNVITNSFAINHVGTTVAANQGKHTNVFMRQIGIHPAANPVTIADEMVLSTMDDGAGNCRLFMTEDLTAGGATRQISNITPTTVVFAGPAPLPTGTLYAIREMSGLIYTWGRLQIPNGTTNTGNLNFPISYAGHNQSVTATIETATSQTVGVAAIIGPTFQLIRSSGTGAITINIIAIG